MLNRVYEAHKFDSDIARARADTLKSQALETVGAVTDSLVECLNGGIKVFFLLLLLLLLLYLLFTCVCVCVCDRRLGNVRKSKRN